MAAKSERGRELQAICIILYYIILHYIIYIIYIILDNISAHGLSSMMAATSERGREASGNFKFYVYIYITNIYILYKILLYIL